MMFFHDFLDHIHRPKGKEETISTRYDKTQTIILANGQSINIL
jgi:hypothetical protein